MNATPKRPMCRTRCAGRGRRTTAAGAIVFLATTVPAWGQAAAEGERVVIQGQAFEVYPAEKLRARGLSVPEIPRERNAAWVYIEAINATVAAPADLGEAYQSAQRGQWPEGEAGEKLAAWLEQNRRAIDLATLAASMPDYHMPLFRGDTDVVLMALRPTLAGQRELGRLLAVDAAHLGSAGRSKDALDRCLALQRMGHQVGDGQTLIDGLVGLAVCSLAEQSFVNIAEFGGAGAEELRAAGAELEALADKFPDWSQMIRHEQAWMTSVIDDAIDMGVAAGVTGGIPSSPREDGPTAWSALANRLKRVYLPDRTMKRHLRAYFDGVARAASTPGAEFPDEKALLSRVPAWNVLARIILPSMERSFQLAQRERSNLVRARTALAIAAYRKDHGANPPSLAALSPKYLKQPPIDPMTGQVLEYTPPAEPRGATGIALVTRENEQEIRASRVPPTEAQRHATRWRRHVEEVCGRYELADAQRASAEAILREIEDRAEALGRAVEPGEKAGGEDVTSRRQAAYDALFDELKRRLDELPTAEQRAAAAARDRKKP